MRFKVDYALTQAGIPRGTWVRRPSKFRDYLFGGSPVETDSRLFFTLPHGPAAPVAR